MVDVHALVAKVEPKFPTLDGRLKVRLYGSASDVETWQIQTKTPEGKHYRALLCPHEMVKCEDGNYRRGRDFTPEEMERCTVGALEDIVNIIAE